MSPSPITGFFRGHDTLWFVPRGDSKLYSPYVPHASDVPFGTASQFSAAMTTIMVGKDFEGVFRKDNDILVLSRSSLGERPQIERVHYYEEEIPTGTPIRNLLAESVHVCDDYNASDRLWLEMNVVEADSVAKADRDALVSAFQSLATTAGAVFPAVLPYAFGASTLAKILGNLVSAIERDTHVIKVPISLYPGDPRPGRAILREGAYVIFSRAVNPEKYTLQPNGLLDSENPDKEISYVVFDISRVKRATPAFVMNQKIATLLTQLKRGSEGRTAKATIEFLSETMSAYDNYQKLNRYLELSEKETLTDEEKSLMKRIKSVRELKDFLPD